MDNHCARRHLAIMLAASMGLSACGGGGSSSSGSPTVAAKSVTANPDLITASPGGTSSLLLNDVFNDASAVGKVNFSLISTDAPPEIVIDNSGIIHVAAAAAPGTYSIRYQICQPDLTSNCSTAISSLTVPAPVALGTVTGQVIDADTGATLANVRVSSGTSTTTTDASGNFSLSGVIAGSRTVISFEADNYAENARIVDLQANGSTETQAKLVRAGVVASVAVSTGATVSVPGSPAQVALAANSFISGDGTTPTGNVKVQVTPLRTAVDADVMPGDFSTSGSTAGELGKIESYGAMNVAIHDMNGNEVNIKPGQRATIRIPVSSRNPDTPASIPLYHFNKTTGAWEEEGTATLVSNGDQSYYEGTVTHFSTWNADKRYETVQVNGCVTDVDGNPVGSVSVSSDGINYSGTSAARTDSNGRFTIPIRKNSLAVLTGTKSGQIKSNSMRVGPYGSDITLSRCLVFGSRGAGLKMTLTWGEKPWDLDSHLFTPNGGHVWYGMLGALDTDPFANLDVDDTSSYGPEVVTISKLMIGTYRYAVNNYSQDGSISASGARVELSLPGQPAQIFAVPSGETSSTNWWVLFDLVVDAHCNVTVQRVQQFQTGQPQTAVVGSRFCTP